MTESESGLLDERAKRYRMLAADALAVSKTAPTQFLQDAYIAVFKGWSSLAKDAERQLAADGRETSATSARPDCKCRNEAASGK